MTNKISQPSTNPASQLAAMLHVQIANFLGFFCYAVYNCALYFNPVVRAQYANDHGGSTSSVQINDVFFSLHALAITTLTLVQCACYERGGLCVSRTCAGLVGGAVVVSAGYATVVALAPSEDIPEAGAARTATCPSCPNAHGWLTWLALVYWLSYVKLAVTLTKYFPQVDAIASLLRICVGFSNDASDCRMHVLGGHFIVAVSLISCCLSILSGHPELPAQVDRRLVHRQRAARL